MKEFKVLAMDESGCIMRLSVMADNMTQAEEIFLEFGELSGYEMLGWSK